MTLPNGLADDAGVIPEGLWPVGVPMGTGHAAVSPTPNGLAIAFDPEDHINDIEFKRCRSLKPGWEGCKGFRVAGSDYCQGHKTMIDNEQARNGAD